MKFATSLIAMLALAGCATTPSRAASSPAECRAALQKGAIEKVSPSPADELVWREEVFELPGAATAVFPAFLEYAKHLEGMLPGTKKFAAVDHNEDLTNPGFPAVGSQRVVCLADGNFALEEVVEVGPHGFRYVVSNYSLEAAKPILYGMGQFDFAAAGDATTRVTWRYSFKLRDDTFPGAWGAFGRSLFRSSFLESDYAEFMRSGVGAMKRWGASR
jgi:hypothetical protein